VTAFLALGDSWYAKALGIDTLDDVLADHPVWRIAAEQSELARGAALWWFGRRWEVVVAPYRGARGLLALERLLPRRQRYLVLLELIPVTTRSWSSLYARGRLGLLLRHIWTRGVLRPAVRQGAIAVHVLSRWERERAATFFGLPATRVHFIPWPRIDQERPAWASEEERSGVLASGRAACDWPTVFATAAREPWQLTVVCSRADLPEVETLNAGGRATVLTDIPLEAHRRLMEQAQVYLLCLREADMSSGHIRVMDAVSSGTPVVASLVRGLEDYVRPGVTALTFPPGDAGTARAEVRRALGDPALRSRLRDAAAVHAGGQTRNGYLDAIRTLVKEAHGATDGQMAD
jgi:hypothetical protein